MRRPVWLLSMDTEQFRAPPMTTGGLKAFFSAYGTTTEATEVELVHFLAAAETTTWLEGECETTLLPRAQAAVAAGLQPVLGLSCYTWNVAEFLAVARRIKAEVPEILIIAGGPHVQRAADFLFDESVDVVVLGEGEETLTAILDRPPEVSLRTVTGCAFVEEGTLVDTGVRPRTRDLDHLPSALDVITLRNEDGTPRYRQISYETSRGCPYRCAFCEWGTGAIGTKMYQLSLARFESDLERIAAGGIRDIWLADSNFGALREDEAKAAMVVALRQQTGLPHTLATSWSKNHNQRVQRIVRSLHQHGLLSHYHLALQTLTPRALELSHRTNMRANDYQPIVKSLAEDGIPVAAELIWGLPGDTLAEFEDNLDHLLTIFPNINIFGYTLLPGTEFFSRRDEYRLETLPVAGYGKAKGEYVVGCHTFPRTEGEEGYFLLAAYIVLARGQLMPFTTRHLAFAGIASVAGLLREVLHALLIAYEHTTDRMTVYEGRAELYVRLLNDRPRTYGVIGTVVGDWLARHNATALADDVTRVLALDEALCPRPGASHTIRQEFDFAADLVAGTLGRMDRPAGSLLAENGGSVELHIEHPAGVGDIMLDPDGGEWVRGRILDAPPPSEQPDRKLASNA